MSDQALRLVISAAVLLHGLGHGGAIVALAWLAWRPGTNTGSWTAARSWLLPSLEPRTATIVACAFWIVALVGFVATVLAFWGVVLPTAAWQPLAIVSAIVSTAGIVVFFGNWPLFNTLAALGANAAVLVALVVAHWEPPAA